MEDRDIIVLFIMVLYVVFRKMVIFVLIFVLVEYIG